MSRRESTLLDFSGMRDDIAETSESIQKEPSIITRVPSELNPYTGIHCPTDICDYLSPDGARFSLFSDPYATMVYVDQGRTRHGRYWLEHRLEDNSFTDRELQLIEFLSTHRVATRNQIHKLIFPGDQNKKTVLDFLQKCRKRGMICAFSWESPLDTPDSLKKPLVYGLSRIGAEASHLLFRNELTNDFWFQPIKFTKGKGVNMGTFFFDLVANELYSELTRIDRCLDWQRRPQIILDDNSYHHPYATFDVIKDEQEFRTFWVEIVRPGKNWPARVKERFKRTQNALSKLPDLQKPARVIVITDGDGRIPVIAKMAEEYMPDVECRYTNDVRLLEGLSRDTFISWDREKQEMQISSIPFLQEGYDGMTASEYAMSQESHFEGEDDLDYEE